MKTFLFLVSPLFFIFSCSTNENYDDQLKGLNKGEARIGIYIGDSIFYSQDRIFESIFNVSESYIGINLTDQFEANFQLQLNKRDWISKKKEPFKVSGDMRQDFPLYGTMLIGKRNKSSLTGYIMTRANFQWLALTENYAVLKCKGFVTKPQDAAIPENEIAFEGNIYFKEPEFNLDGIDKKDLF